MHEVGWRVSLAIAGERLHAFDSSTYDSRSRCLSCIAARPMVHRLRRPRAHCSRADGLQTRNGNWHIALQAALPSSCSSARSCCRRAPTTWWRRECSVCGNRCQTGGAVDLWLSCCCCLAALLASCCPLAACSSHPRFAVQGFHHFPPQCPFVFYVQGPPRPCARHPGAPARHQAG